MKLVDRQHFELPICGSISTVVWPLLHSEKKNTAVSLCTLTQRLTLFVSDSYDTEVQNCHHRIPITTEKEGERNPKNTTNNIIYRKRQAPTSLSSTNSLLQILWIYQESCQIMPKRYNATLKPILRGLWTEHVLGANF